MLGHGQKTLASAFCIINQPIKYRVSAVMMAPVNVSQASASIIIERWLERQVS